MTQTISSASSRGQEAVNGAAPQRVVLEGVVTYDGPIPDPVVNHEADTVRPLVEVEPKTKGLKDAVVWLEGVSPRLKQDQEPPKSSVLMDQRNFAFVPHVLAVEAGCPVEFANHDIANHSVIASSLEPRNRFNRFTPPGGGYTHRFVTSKEPVAIGCSIHVAMSAWVYVFDHPYFAVTNRQGRFRLPPMAPGRYRVHVRHADGGMRSDQEVVARIGEPLNVRVGFHRRDLKIQKVVSHDD